MGMFRAQELTFAGRNEGNTSLLGERHSRSFYLKSRAAPDHMRLTGKLSTCSNDSG